jgi:hypothetical protein
LVSRTGIEYLGRDLFRAAVGDDTCTVQDQVDGARHGKCFGDGLRDAGVVAHVHRYHQRRRPAGLEALPLGLTQGGLATRDEHDMVTVAGRLDGCRSSDAARCSRHHDDPRRSGHGFSTTLMQPSCFFWNIS